MLNIFTLANGRLFQEEIESLEELSKFNLSHDSDVKITEWLDLRIEYLGVLVKLVHIFVFELLRIVRVVLDVVKLRVLFAQVIFFKVNHY